MGNILGYIISSSEPQAFFQSHTDFFWSPSRFTPVYVKGDAAPVGISVKICSMFIEWSTEKDASVLTVEGTSYMGMWGDHRGSLASCYKSAPKSNHTVQEVCLGQIPKLSASNSSNRN